MNYKKIWMVTLALVLVFIFAGCSMTQGTANEDNGQQQSTGDIQSSIAAISSDSENIEPISSTTISASIEDFNSATMEGYSEDPFTLLVVTLDNGNTIDKKFAGAWASSLGIGNFNNDVQEDYVILLKAVSTLDGNNTLHVFNVVDNELVEYPQNFITNSDNENIPKSFGVDDIPYLSDVSVITIEGQDYLEITFYLDASKSTSQDLLASYNGEGWVVLSSD